MTPREYLASIRKAQSDAFERFALKAIEIHLEHGEEPDEVWRRVKDSKAVRRNGNRAMLRRLKEAAYAGVFAPNS